MSKKSIFVAFLFFLFLVVLVVLYEKKIHGMHVKNFAISNWPKTEAVRYSESDIKSVRKILKQPFYYKGHGRQFYVFESADQKWVIKFVRGHRFRVWYENLPLPGFLDEKRKAREEEKNKKLTDLFSSLYLAKEHIPQLTGVKYVNVDKKKRLKMRLTIFNRAKVQDKVVLDDTAFVLQKKAEPVFSTLRSAMDESDRVLRWRLQQLVDLEKGLAAAGIVDRDAGGVLRDNVGYTADRAIFVDVGTFYKDSFAEVKLSETLLKLKPVTKWLQEKEPYMAKEFQQMIEDAQN